MSIKEVKLVPVMLKAFCDKCNAQMACSGNPLLVQPPKYIHTCPNCGHTEEFDEVYPTLTFKEIE